MSEVWLIVVSVIVSVLLLLFSFYLLVYYSHPDDRRTAYLPKIVVVLSFTLSEVLILMLALDVANQAGNPLCGRLTNFVVVPRQPNNGSTPSPATLAPTIAVEANDSVLDVEYTYSPPCGALDIRNLWTAMWFIVAVFVAIIIPFNIFFYEAQDAGKRKLQSKICEALQSQVIALVIVGLVLGLMYWQINMFSMPIKVVPNEQGLNGATVTCASVDDPACLEVDIQGQLQILFNPNTTDLTVLSSDLQSSDLEQKIKDVPNAFGIYLGSFMSFIGWWLFCIYTGVGFITLPVDLIKAYMYRPKYIPKDVYIKLREDIRLRLNSLTELGEKLKTERLTYDREYKNLGYLESRSKSSAQRQAFKEFKKAVLQLEMDYEDIRLCHEAWSSYNPLIPYFKLTMGIISVILTLLWLLQILLYIFPQYWPTGASYIPTFFLNDFLTWGLVYSGFSLIGVFFLALFGLYLLACNAQGNFKIGLRYTLVEIHPMIVGGTYMSSFLVNVLLLLLQTPALINFLALAFSNTIVLTDIDLTMNYATRYTIFFIYFFENNVFIFLLLAFTVLSACLTWVIPDDRKRDAKRLKKKIDRLSSEIDQKKRAADGSKVRGLNLKSIVQEATKQREEEEANGRNEDGAPPPKGALGVA